MTVGAADYGRRMSPRQNRVTPTGQIVAIPLRGSWMGNRGILHDDAGRVIRNHASQLWIICRLSFRGWRAAQWQPHRYTVLFFHDEAVALAAGHRPCALCRRPSYDAYRNAVADHEGTKPLSAKEIDARLHGERLVLRSRTRRLHEMQWAGVPSGAFVVVEDEPHLVGDEGLVRWTTTGYAQPRGRPSRGTVPVLTPPTSVVALRAGYAPQVADRGQG
jgi:hypothetical protein